MTGRAHIIRGNALALPLPDACVDLVVTSPPYWSLRSYSDGGRHYDGQLGSELTAAEFIDNLILKPTGCAFVNLGDKYGPNKSLMLLPERYRIACIDRLGLIARAVIIWGKPNGLPESVTDRVRRSHEDWVHLTKSPRYFSAVDEIREPHAPNYASKYPNGQGGKGGNRDRNDGGIVTQKTVTDLNPLGKLPGSVWGIATQPLTVPPELGVDHFAAFPMEWPRRIIAGWSPTGICTVCGEGRRPVSVSTGRVVASDGRDQYGAYAERRGRGEVNGNASRQSGTGTAAMPRVERLVTGYACACPDTIAPTRPALILDPFGGTGTTALVASVMGRIGLSVDMSADYCRLAEWRVNDPGQRAAAAQVEKPEPIHPDQLELDLFADEVPA